MNELVAVVEYLHVEQFPQQHGLNPAVTISLPSDFKTVFTSIFRNVGPLLYEVNGGFGKDSPHDGDESSNI